MKVEKTNNGKKGGLLKGKPHYDKDGNSLGGIKAVVTDAGNRPVELEGGEVIINKEASKKHWKLLSKINQSAGGGVPIGPPSGADFDEDPEEFKEGGRIIEFNPNHVPNKWVVQYAEKIKKDHPEIWKLGGNIFGNQAFENLLRVSKRGYWLDSEEWMYIKWRSYVARHIHDFRIEGVVAMLKWCDKVEKGWAYMKDLIEEKIDKIESKEEKFSEGGKVVDKEQRKEIVKILQSFGLTHSKSKTKLKEVSFDRFEKRRIVLQGGYTLSNDNKLIQIDYDNYALEEKYGKKNFQKILEHQVEFIKKISQELKNNGFELYDYGYPSNYEISIIGKKNQKMTEGGRIAKRYDGLMEEKYSLLNRLNELPKIDSRYEKIQERINKISKQIEKIEKSNPKMATGGKIMANLNSSLLNHFENNKKSFELSDIPKEILNKFPGYDKNGNIIYKSDIESNIYAGVKGNKKLENIISWTIDEETAEAFASKYEDGKLLELTPEEFKENFDFISLDVVVDYIYKNNLNSKETDKYYSESEIYAFPKKKMATGGRVQKQTTGNKILDKLAKLLKQPKATIEITSNQVRSINGKFSFSGPSTFFVKKSPSNDYYFLMTNKGTYRVEEKDVTKAEDLYDELESIIQAGRTKRAVECDLFGNPIMAKGGEVGKIAPDRINELSATLLNQLKRYAKENYNEDVIDDTFMLKGEEKNKDFQVKEVSIDTASGREIHITIQELFMKRGGELSKGIRAELEHKKTISKIYNREVSKSKAAELIAKDHLKEDPKYYSKLEQIEGKKFATGSTIEKFDIGDRVYLNTKKGKIEVIVTKYSDKWVQFDDLTKGKSGRWKATPEFKQEFDSFVNQPTPTTTTQPTTTATPVTTNGFKVGDILEWKEDLQPLYNAKKGDKAKVIEIATEGEEYDIYVEWISATTQENGWYLSSMFVKAKNQVLPKSPAQKSITTVKNKIEPGSLLSRIEKLEPTFIPSTDPSTWDAEFNVGDVVKIRVDLEDRYPFTKVDGTPVKYEDGENSDTIIKVEVVEEAKRKENPSGKIYTVGFKGNWEGKDLELAYIVDKKEPQQKLAQQQKQQSASKRQPKIEEPEPPKRKFKEGADYLKIFTEYFEKDTQMGRPVKSESFTKAIVNDFIIATEDISGFSKDKLKEIKSFIDKE